MFARCPNLTAGLLPIKLSGLIAAVSGEGWAIA